MSGYENISEDWRQVRQEWHLNIENLLLDPCKHKKVDGDTITNMMLT